MSRPSRSRIGFLEIPAADPERSVEFFVSVFGWRVRRRQSSDGAYVELANVADGAGCALVPPSVLGHDSPTPVVHVEAGELASSLARIESGGGTVIEAPRRVGSQGRFARFADPDGNVWGLWAPAPSESDS